MNNTLHTPTPWQVWHNYGGAIQIFRADCRNVVTHASECIAEVPRYYDGDNPRAEIDAAFIVRAVNNLDPLVKAADSLLVYLAGYEDDWNNKQPLPAFEELRKALAQAKGEQA